ncbi:hypothetical protein [Aquibacillus saliphilus]|uniref:hypothetical protein n=1 Tax=Aquibacillus saliphilus TaxID=1909422 RepID=UPI001CEFC0BF|nr:hypothetical protein [Aquibacillus saliphilus]
MEFLTLGQVIDTMKLDEVAIKVDGEYGDCLHGDKIDVVKGILYINNENYFLYGDDCRKITGIYNPPNVKEDKFIIVSREMYENMKDYIY